MKPEIKRSDWDWIRVPLVRCVEALEEQDIHTRATLRGFQLISGMPRLFDALDKVDEIRQENRDAMNAERRKRNKEESLFLSEFVNKQKTNQFPVLYANSSILRWVHIEALIYDIVVTCLLRKPEFLLSEPFSTTKVDVFSMRTFSENEIMYQVCKDALDTCKGGRAPGISKFDVYLETVGLRPLVSKRTRKDMLELFLVRNLLLHRGGVVDPQFKRACAWRKVPAVGKNFTVKYSDHIRYKNASMDYLFGVINCIRQRCGLSRVKKPKRLSARKRKRHKTTPSLQQHHSPSIRCEASQ